LRERRFGDLELKKDDAYGQIWTLDSSDPGHHECNVESACEVMDRTSALIAELEDQSNGVTYLLVSHGDALQILQAAFYGRSAAHHRELPHLETAEIRWLKL
jgi:probable phosphoglycerate mutase